MSISGTHRRHRGLPPSDTRFLLWLSLIAGIVAGSFLLAFRLLGYLQPDEYSYLTIALQTLGMSLAFPIGLTFAIWISDTPAAEIWYTRLGAIIIFVVIPLLIVLAIVRTIFGG